MMSSVKEMPGLRAGQQFAREQEPKRWSFEDEASAKSLRRALKGDCVF